MKVQGGKMVQSQQQAPTTLRPGYYLAPQGAGGQNVQDGGGLIKSDGKMYYFWIPREHRWGAGSTFIYLNNPQNPYSARDVQFLKSVRPISASIAEQMMGAPTTTTLSTSVAMAAQEMREAKWNPDARIKITLIQ